MDHAGHALPSAVAERALHDETGLKLRSGQRKDRSVWRKCECAVGVGLFWFKNASEANPHSECTSARERPLAACRSGSLNGLATRHLLAGPWPWPLPVCKQDGRLLRKLFTQDPIMKIQTTRMPEEIQREWTIDANKGRSIPPMDDMTAE